MPLKHDDQVEYDRLKDLYKAGETVQVNQDGLVSYSRTLTSITLNKGELFELVNSGENDSPVFVSRNLAFPKPTYFLAVKTQVGNFINSENQNYELVPIYALDRVTQGTQHNCHCSREQIFNHGCVCGGK